MRQSFKIKELAHAMENVVGKSVKNPDSNHDISQRFRWTGQA